MQKLARSRQSLFAALSVYFLDNFALAVVYPIFTPLLFSSQSTYLSNVTTHRIAYLGILIASFPLAQLIGSPLIGMLSDRFGRKRTFYLTLIGELIGFLASGIAIQFNSFYFLMASRLWTGFFAANLTICLAVFADVHTPIKQRSKSFGYLMMMGGLSFIIAIIVGGLFSNTDVFPYFTPSMPFWITAGLCLVNLLIVKRLFLETATKAKDHGIRDLCQVCSCKEYRNIRLLYFCYFFFMFAWLPALQFLSPLLYIDYGAKPLIITATFLGVGLAWSLSSGPLNHYLVKRFNSGQILKFSLPLLSICLAATNLPYRLWSICIIIALASFAAALSWVSLLSLISHHAKKNMQGKVLGLNQAFGASAMILGPLAAGYFGTISTHTIYLVSAISVLIATFIKK